VRGLDETLRQAVAEHGGNGLVLLCSFQKEESVIVDALARLDALDQVRVVTIDTGVLFPETLQTWRAYEQRWDLKVHVEDAANPSDPWSGPEHCCGAAKVDALERALAGASAWITGIRREQSETRADAQLIEVDDKRGGIAKYNPLAQWTEKDLWNQIVAADLPYNPLHDQGYASIGCAPCTNPGSGRDGRWAGLDKTECGLHV
jgi:phosphoadenosine phosphosulfate reductase